MIHHAKGRLIVAAMVVLAAGCGNGGDAASAGSSDSSPAATTTTPASATTLLTTTAPPTTAIPTTTTIAATTTTVDPIAADTVLIKALWRQYSDSWFGGAAAGLDFIASHNYPNYFDDYDELASCGISVVEEEVVVDQSSIEPDPSWIMTSGLLADQPIEGRIYILAADFVTTYESGEVQTGKQEFHTVVLDGVAYMFYGC